MYKLVGYNYDDERIVALFTTKEKAEEYEKKARLKSYRSAFGDRYKQYRAKSVLHNHIYAHIEHYEEETYEIDPEIE